MSTSYTVQCSAYCVRALDKVGNTNINNEQKHSTDRIERIKADAVLGRHRHHFFHNATIKKNDEIRYNIFRYH